MLNLEEVRALAGALNYGWGGHNDQYKLTHNLAGDVLDLQATSIVYFAAERGLQVQVVAQREISNEVFANALKEIKSHFKDAAGRTLKVEEISRDDDVELISATSNSPRKIACYRAMLKLKVS
tara:strand:- start:15 stop:383 length:369 start_codon:yes stop_codon:yes gene_type:complete